MKKIILLFCSVFSILSANAAPGDTTWVSVHDHVDMTWYGNYDRTAYFPNSSTTYSKILLYWDMGCASTGCSDWDYDVHIQAGKYLGYNDSTVASIDTITGDTTWNIFPAVEIFELAKVITPYGNYMASGSNGFNNSWSHTHIFDVTDFSTILRDSVLMRAFYSGWSSGFSTTLRFAFIEGTPPRNVLDVRNVYNGYFNYVNSSDFEANYLPSKNIVPPTNSKGAKFRTIPTGHGFDNDLNCAEFCPKNYFLQVNGITRFTQLIWRDDCGFNPIYPQGGTWLYDRANWCPGLRAQVFEHDLTPYTTAGTPFNLDMNMDTYVWTGTQTPGYAIASQIVFYEDPNLQTDVELTEIIAPSKIQDYGRLNPTCDNPLIRIKNLGSDNLTSVQIGYGIVGNVPQYYHWTGNLAFGEDEVVTLPIFNWNGVDVTQPKFFCELTYPNGILDEQTQNNKIITPITLVPKLDSVFVVWLYTNNMASENQYTIENENGTVVYSRSGLANNTQYKDTISFAKGCYKFTLSDAGGDGLAWWANPSAGSGFIRFRKQYSVVSIKNFQADFGEALTYYFTVGETGGNDEIVGDTTTIVENNYEGYFDVYPNPARNQLHVDFSFDKDQEGILNIYDMTGKNVRQQSIASIQHRAYILDISDLPKGMYIVQFNNIDLNINKKLLIQE